MKIGLNKLLYDDADPRCMCIVNVACGQVYGVGTCCRHRNI